MFGAEGDPGPIERVIRRSEDSNANPRTDKVARTGVVHVPATRQGGCNTPHGVLGGPADNTITSDNEGREVHPPLSGITGILPAFLTLMVCNYGRNRLLLIRSLIVVEHADVEERSSALRVEVADANIRTLLIIGPMSGLLI